MPLRAGSLQNLADDVSRPCTFDDLCTQVLQQMLGALDYLDCNGMCHRDVKPDNILYWDNTGHGVYTFQLADFGLAKHHLQATTLCGTPLYEVPELYPDLYGDYPQSPKMDIWSLFATIIHVHPEFAFPPRSHITSAIISAVEAAADIAKRLSPMARRNRHHRASAAQMLMLLFDGQGLTTAKHLVPAITNQPAPARPHPLLPAQHRVPSVAVPPLVQYPRNKQPRLAKGLGLQLRQQRLPRRKIGVPAPRGVVPDGRIVKPASAGVGAAAARPRPPC
ncbi:hypothetical protein SCUCBS95973_003172 [Sporothrix curviconia]|uniref:non-specific serine/threonine protein kinase n=1 Tax=Sporothrix curviconia TaxID=1260050 RepID=A0ABP0BE54_9PEZI